LKGVFNWSFSLDSKVFKAAILTAKEELDSAIRALQTRPRPTSHLRRRKRRPPTRRPRRPRRQRRRRKNKTKKTFEMQSTRQKPRFTLHSWTSS
jgi:hypothetical protein